MGSGKHSQRLSPGKRGRMNEDIYRPPESELAPGKTRRRLLPRALLFLLAGFWILLGGTLLIDTGSKLIAADSLHTAIRQLLTVDKILLLAKGLGFLYGAVLSLFIQPWGPRILFGVFIFHTIHAYLQQHFLFFGTVETSIFLGLALSLLLIWFLVRNIRLPTEQP